MQDVIASSAASSIGGPEQGANDARSRVVSTDTMFERVLEYLDHVSLSVAMTPCRAFLRRCLERRLWYRLVERRWPGVLSALGRPLTHERTVYIELSVPPTPRPPVGVAGVVIVLELFLNGERRFCTSHTILEPRPDDAGDPNSIALGYIPVTCVPATREYFFPVSPGLHHGYGTASTNPPPLFFFARFFCLAPRAHTNDVFFTTAYSHSGNYTATVKFIRKTDGSCRTCRIGDVHGNAQDYEPDYEGLYADVGAYWTHGRVRCPSGVCASTKDLFRSSATEGTVYSSELELVLTPSVPGNDVARPVSVGDDNTVFDLRLHFNLCNCEYDIDEDNVSHGGNFEVSSGIGVAATFAHAMDIMFSVTDQHTARLGVP